MSLALRLIAAFATALLACTTVSAQPPTAPPPHLALDEFVKEYKRLGLPLPPPNAELVRVKLIRIVYEADELAFRIPSTKPGEEPKYLVGAITEDTVISAELLKPGSDMPVGVEPVYVSDMLCLAVQCRVHGLNEFAKLLYARAHEAIINPVPARMGFGFVGPTRVNGWELREANTSALKELHRAASNYWLDEITAPNSDRKEVLRHLKELEPGRTDDIRALELTVAPRKSKPGTVEALIDDLLDYQFSGKSGSTPLDENERGEAAYRKLVELGFDAVPALLEHLGDERFTRYTSHRFALYSKTPSGSILRVQIGHLVGQLLHDLSGREFSDITGPQRIDADKAREWWVKARKGSEEKWLVAHAVPEFVNSGEANDVIFRALGAKYPARLGEFYRTVLAKHPQAGSRVLADEVAASKLPCADKLALLVEGAEHKSLAHRNAALAALARLDTTLFQKHLLATLKKLPPDSKQRFRFNPLTDLSPLVRLTDDRACWDALAALAKQLPVSDRIEIISCLHYWPNPDRNKPTRRELIRFLLQFISDAAQSTILGRDDEEVPYQRVRDVAAGVLAWQLEMKIPIEAQISYWSGGLERMVFCATVAKLATEELERLKK